MDGLPASEASLASWAAWGLAAPRIVSPAAALPATRPRASPRHPELPGGRHHPHRSHTRTINCGLCSQLQHQALGTDWGLGVSIPPCWSVVPLLALALVVLPPGKPPQSHSRICSPQITTPSSTRLPLTLLPWAVGLVCSHAVWDTAI